MKITRETIKKSVAQKILVFLRNFFREIDFGIGIPKSVFQGKNNQKDEFFRRSRKTIVEPKKRVFYYFLRFIDSALSFLALVLINLYQKTISPDHSLLGKAFPYTGCKYYPSCSEYAKGYITEYGLWSSLIPIWKRIRKCNPQSEGGVDPVPKVKE